MDAGLKLQAVQTLAEILNSQLNPHMAMPVVRNAYDTTDQPHPSIARLWQIPEVSADGYDAYPISSPVWLSDSAEFVIVSQIISSCKIGSHIIQQDSYWVPTYADDSIIDANSRAISDGLLRLCVYAKNCVSSTA